MEHGRADAFEKELQTFSEKEQAKIRRKLLAYEEHMRVYPGQPPPAGYNRKVLVRLADGGRIVQIYCGKAFRAAYVSLQGGSTAIWLGVRRKSKQVDQVWVRDLQRRADGIVRDRSADC